MRLLTVLHTNDIHGRFDNLARLATLARRERTAAEAAGRTVFQFDAGDAFDRRYEEGRISRGRILPPVLTAAGVTLQTIGNDIGLVYGMQALSDMANAADYPILGANLQHHDGTLVDGLQASVVLDGPDHLCIGVVGVTAPWDGMYGLYGLAVPDEIDVVRQEVAALRARGADMVILLSHLGTEPDQQVAREVEGIDAIVGGHWHQLLPEGIEENGIPIVQAGNYAEHLGRLDLDVDDAGHVVRWSATVIPNSPDVEPSPAVEAAIALVAEQTAELKSRPVGKLASALSLDHYGESPLTNFIAGFLRERAGAEIGMVASGASHGPLPQGVVSHGEMATAVLVPIFPMVSIITGEALRAALERSLDPAVVQTMNNSLRGTPYGVLGLSGVEVTVDGNAPAGQRAAAVLVNGAPLDEKRHYRVAHTDLDTPDTYLMGEGIQTEKEEYVLVEDLLREHCAATDVVEPEIRTVWHGIEKLTDLRP